MYSRAGVFPIQKVLPFVIDKPRGGVKMECKKKGISYRDFVSKVWSGYPVKMDSLRYQLFKTKGVVCVECGIEGKFFALESSKGTCELSPDTPFYHFNLYGIDKNGCEVLITKDHIIPKSRGGKDNIDNMQVMCSPCNQEKDCHVYEEVIPIYCCASLKSNLNDKCKQEGHGWLCPDNALYLYRKSSTGRTIICVPMDHDNKGVGTHWQITHCPWCGKKIQYKKGVNYARTGGY